MTVNDMEMPTLGTVTRQALFCDPVNHPEHYTYGSVECIDAMLETQGADAVIHFCECNAFKYMWRHRHKKGVEDLKKASWYLTKALELIEENMGSVSDGR